MSTNLISQVLLNQFRVDSFIASGGMGAVYRVWDLKRNVPLAMKVLHADLAEDPSMFKRFKREANALKKLAHPNIVPFYGLYQTADFAFLLERYVDGPSLKEILRNQKGRPLPMELVLSILKALSAALGYAHANGVVHCDVKPGNVMTDKGGNIYLTDFGIARHSESTTTTLATVGTAAYMAPEQIRGEPVSPATDIYALGVVLYEMLTGQRPFRGDEKGTESSGSTANERIRYGHLTLQPPDPRKYNPEFPKNLALAILTALQKNPLKRYQKVQDLFKVFCDSSRMGFEQIPYRIPIEKTVPGVTPETPVFNKSLRPRRPAWLYFVVGFFLIGIIGAGWSFNKNRNSIVVYPTSDNPVARITSSTYSIHPTLPVTSGMDTPTVTKIQTATSILPTTISISTPSQNNRTITAADGSVLVDIPEGKFLMGLSSEQLNDILRMCPICDPSELVDTAPQRQIYLDSYWIGQKEITNAQFTSFIEATGYKTTAEIKGGAYVYPPNQDAEPPYVNGADWRHPFGVSSSIIGRDQNPVVQVSWDDAYAYCAWAGLRLPTEAEWEKAARGEQDWLFPWGNTPPNSDLLNYNHENYGPLNVGSFPQGRSPYGLFDMAGNVWEWVSDFYLESYYQIMPDQNPGGPSSGDGHPFRGGSWASDRNDYLYLVATVYRLWNYSYIRSNVIGFRCAMDGKDLSAPSFGEIHFCSDRNCLDGPRTNFPGGTKEIYFSYEYRNMKPNSSYGRRWYVNGNIYLDYSCTWGSDWPSDGSFLKKVYDYDYGLAPGEWRLETYIDNQLQATARFTVQGPIRYENFLEGYSCNDTSPTVP